MASPTRLGSPTPPERPPHPHIEAWRASIEGGDPRDAASLAAQGLDLQARGGGGSTLALLCVSLGKMKYLRALAEASAGTLDIHTAEDRGFTPLAYACWTQDSAAVQTLLDLGADPSERLSLAVDGALKRREPGHLTESFPLQAALLTGKRSPDCLRPLLDAGADLAMVDADGMTALATAARLASCECLRVLASATVQSGLDLDQPDHQGRTPLMIAAAVTSDTGVRILLDHGADPRRVDRAGWNAARHANQFFKVRDITELLDVYAAMLDEREALGSLLPPAQVGRPKSL